MDFAKKMKALVRSKKGRKSENCREGRPLDPAEMTGFLHKPVPTDAYNDNRGRTVHGHKNTCAENSRRR